ncbi:MAG: hypothetical protein H7258_10720 [Ferruginibacter sp.]|nr:hypothetical protein [Ferruginibacter sp.]
MMKKFLKSLFFLGLFIVLGHTLPAQRLDSLLNQLNVKYPQEKLYLQYDRPYYNPGETIWFKAYLTSGNLPSAISKTIYAELINEKGIVLQKKIMPVIESGGASFFDLADTMPGNVVYIRAYTAWMLNFDSTLLYHKPISIINPVKKTIPTPGFYSVNFFPEGGDLVAGIESLVAFKATDQSGNPVNINGSIIDGKGKKVSAFAPTHNGMGTFALKPLEGESYKATWKDKKGSSHETQLPETKKEGVALSLNKVRDHVTYTLKRTDSAAQAFTSYFVIAQMQQQVIYSARINLSAKNEVTAPIPIDSLATGIVQLTIFNADEIPVAERIFFINHDNYYFNTDLHAMELNFSKRKRNILQVDVGGSIVTNLSVSVTDEGFSTAPANRDNIYSNVLLSSDLKGYVYNPAYYFSSLEDSVAQQLDLVMLTNGWRRFKWENLVAGKWPVIKNLPEDYITISGNVYGPTANILKGKEITGILNTKGGDDLFTMPVNKDGKFEASGVAFFDTAKLYYQFNQDKDKVLTSTSSFSIKTNFVNAVLPAASFLNNFFAPVVPDTGMAVKNKKIAKLLQQEFKEGNKIKSLEVVTVKTRVKTAEQKLDEKYTSGFFTGGDGYSFSVADDPNARTALSILDYLRSKVAGLQISTSGTPSATWRGSATSIFLNESATELSQVQTISMNDVAMIKVFRPPFFSSSGGGAGGAIAVYLKKGDQGNKDFKGMDFVRLNGYSGIKEFYSPDYEKLTGVVPENDLRTTLYWNPYLLMDKSTRRIKIPFYNTDNCKKIRVIIEGMNKEGLLTREEKVFE